MRLIKFIFWIAATVSLAYFMTDFKVGGKTIKEQIDTFLHSEQGATYKQKAKDLADQFIGATLGKDNTRKPLPQGTPEDIKLDERTQLEKLLENSENK